MYIYLTLKKEVMASKGSKSSVNIVVLCDSQKKITLSLKYLLNKIHIFSKY